MPFKNNLKYSIIITHMCIYTVYTPVCMCVYSIVEVRENNFEELIILFYLWSWGITLPSPGMHRQPFTF